MARGERTVNIADEGISYQSSHSHGTYYWDGIMIERLGDFVHIKFKSYLLFLIPTKASGSPEEADRFLELANTYLSPQTDRFRNA